MAVSEWVSPWYASEMRWRSICRFRLSFGRRHLWFRRCTMERGRERNRCVLLPLRVRSSTLQLYPHTLAVTFISFSSLTKSTWVFVSRAISRLTIFHVCLELAQEKLEKAHACSSPHSDPGQPPQNMISNLVNSPLQLIFFPPYKESCFKRLSSILSNWRNMTSSCVQHHTLS